MHEKEEMDFLLKTEEETKVPVMVGQCIRLWSEYAWLKDAVTSKVYGKVCSAVLRELVRHQPGHGMDGCKKQNAAGR